MSVFQWIISALVWGEVPKKLLPLSSLEGSNVLRINNIVAWQVVCPEEGLLILSLGSVFSIPMSLFVKVLSISPVLSGFQGEQERIAQRKGQRFKMEVGSYGNSQDAPPLTNGLRKCGIYTQWNFMQP
jgi:hypothetical protein